MQLSENSINSYKQILDLYLVTRQPSMQSTHTAIKVLHAKLTELIKAILDKPNTTKDTARQVSSMINSNKVVLIEKGAISNVTVAAFDCGALKESFKKKYEELEDSDNPKGADFIKFLEDQCKGTEAGVTHGSVNPLMNLHQFLANQGIHIPTEGEIATRGYEYNRGHMGVSSKWMQWILEGVPTESYGHPDDGDDLSRCVFYLEEYLRKKGRNDLTDDEKSKFNAYSQWSGIMENLDELRAAINNRMSLAETKQLLQRCMNGGSLRYAANEEQEITTEQKQDISNLIKHLRDNQITEENLNLKDVSRVYANNVVRALHDNGYYIEFRYKNPGMSDGVRKLSRATGISMLNRSEYYYSERNLFFRPRTAADSIDTGITEASKNEIRFTF